MSEWIKVITNPLGLVGFVLFLIFGLLAKAKQRDERRWLFPSALILALIALLGGLGLAYVQLNGPQPAASRSPAPQVQQTTSGPGSPNVHDVKGDVNITIDQSTEASKASDKKLAPKTK